MTLLTPTKPELGWTTLEAPELMQWSKPGLGLAGVLTNVTHTTIREKSVPEYTLTLGTQRFRFLGTYDIVQKLTAAHVGCKVRIKYLGDDDTVRGGPDKTPMKRFDIQIAGTPSNGSHGGPITDEDIPY